MYLIFYMARPVAEFNNVLAGHMPLVLTGWNDGTMDHASPICQGRKSETEPL